MTSPPYFGLRDYGYDGQIGLEDTPAAFVARLVDVFREVRRVLSPSGVCWVNMGDSYASSPPGNVRGVSESSGLNGASSDKYRDTLMAGHATKRDTSKMAKPKDLLGIPWRLAFGLQDDGWWLRSDVIWAKPNPMPESVTDRPTKAHEYLFLLTKSPRYYWDAEGVREPDAGTDHRRTVLHKPEPSGGIAPPNAGIRQAEGRKGLGRNMRSVWTFPTEPNPDAHFATFPRELVRRCLAASCPEHVCAECGEPRRRIVERQEIGDWRADADGDGLVHRQRAGLSGADYYAGRTGPVTLGWTDCGHDAYRPGVVLDPFVGSGTTAVVARAMRRHAVGIDGSAEYLDIAKRRLDRERARAWVIPGPAHVIDDGQLSMEGV